MSENQSFTENQAANENQAPLENQPAAENVTPSAMESNLPVPAPVTPAAPPPVIAPPVATTAAPRSRPFGVTLIAILAVIEGLGGFCAGVFILTVGGVLAVIPSGFTQILAILACLGGLLVIIGPLLHLIFAYGAWNLRKWAWTLGVIATSFSILGVALGLVATGGAALWAIVTNALLPIVILAYLLTPNIRKAFNA